MPGPSLVVRAPATSANLGPGFDCLGMALNIWNELAVETGNRLTIDIEGEGANSLPRDESNIIFQTIKRFYDKLDKKVPVLHLRCTNRIPLCRGLGSSSAAIVSGLLAANYLAGKPAKKTEILQEAAAIEGHADNVAPAIFGGCRIVYKDNSQFLHSLIPVEMDLKAVLFIPDFETPTGNARAILPPMVSRTDAIYNISRVALLVNSLLTQRLNYLKWATQDRLHQPHRQALFPAMEKIFEAALSAGAEGVFLSGAGSTILALSSDGAPPIARAMVRAAEKEGLKGKTVITRPVRKGAHVLEVRGEKREGGRGSERGTQ